MKLAPSEGYDYNMHHLVLNRMRGILSSADAITTPADDTPAITPSDNFVVFEQPLNERMRTLMRLEFLFDKLMHFIGGEAEWDSRVSMDALLEILNLLNRSDIKSELIKEVERQIAALERIPDKPGIDGSLRTHLVRQLQDSLGRLRNINGMAGNDLKRNEFMRAISQRASTPGGTSPVDLPNVHFWLQQEASVRGEFLQGLLTTVAPVKSALDMVLNLIRESSPASDEIAVRGSYSRNLEPEVTYQLVRILVNARERCIAEISTGKYRTSIRFLEPSTEERPKLVERDIPFHIICCRL